MSASRPKKDQIILDHPILSRAYAIKAEYVTEEEALEAPHTPQEFLDWWWETRAKGCQQCILSEHRTLVVKPDGHLGSGIPQILVVGEGPGVMEDFTGLPLVGPHELRASRCGWCKGVGACYSHKMLPRPDSRHPRNKQIVCNPRPSENLQLDTRFYLQSAGAVFNGLLVHNWKYAYPRHNWIELYNKLHPDEPWTHASPWFITNTIQCRSFDVVRNKDQDPGTVPKSRCKKWLTWVWAAVQPKVIVALGRPAMATFVPDKSIPQVTINEPIETKYGTVLFQNHPAHAMREENSTVQALQFAKLGETLRRALEIAGYAV